MPMYNLIGYSDNYSAPNNRNKKVIFKNCAPFTDCISEINNKKIDNAKEISVVMPMYNLIGYSDNYSAPNNRNKKVIFKNCAPFTDCISEINNKKIDNAKEISVVMPMYNLIGYSDNYSAPNNRNKKVIFKNGASFTDCISEINNKEIDHAKEIGVVMPMYNLM